MLRRTYAHSRARRSRAAAARLRGKAMRGSRAQVRAEDGVGPPDYEVVAEIAQLLAARLACRHLRIRRVWLAPAEDWPRVHRAEAALVAQYALPVAHEGGHWDGARGDGVRSTRIRKGHSRCMQSTERVSAVSEQAYRVAKVDHRVELVEVILHGRAREQHAPRRAQAIEGHGRRCFVVLQTVGLVADQQADVCGDQLLRRPRDMGARDKQHEVSARSPCEGQAQRVGSRAKPFCRTACP